MEIRRDPSEFTVQDVLSKYKAADPREAENIVEAWRESLQDCNMPTVLFFQLLSFRDDPSADGAYFTITDVIRHLCKKMAPPLVTLLSAEPEIQYCCTSTLNLILQKRPNILAHDIKVVLPIFLKKPTERPQQMIQVVLNNATTETNNLDLRVRAYIYSRLLSSDPETIKDVLLAEKLVITDDLKPT